MGIYCPILDTNRGLNGGVYCVSFYRVFDLIMGGFSPLIYQIAKPRGARATPSAYVIFMCCYTEGENGTVNHFR